MLAPNKHLFFFIFPIFIVKQVPNNVNNSSAVAVQWFPSYVAIPSTTEKQSHKKGGLSVWGGGDGMLLYYTQHQAQKLA